MIQEEVIKKAKEIKKQGGIGKLSCGLSNYPQDSLDKAIKKSNELIRRLSDKSRDKLK